MVKYVNLFGYIVRSSETVYDVKIVPPNFIALVALGGAMEGSAWHVLCCV